MSVLWGKWSPAPNLSYASAPPGGEYYPTEPVNQYFNPYDHTTNFSSHFHSSASSRQLWIVGELYLNRDIELPESEAETSLSNIECSNYHKTQADARHLAAPPGDKVWLSTRDIRLRLPCRKRSSRFIGTFTIRRQTNEVTYQLDLPPTYCITPTFHVPLLKPQTNPMSPSSTGSDGGTSS